jgi:hypothetical protein
MLSQKQIANRRHHNSDEHQCGNRAGTLTAKPREGLYRLKKDIEQADRHRGSLETAGLAEIKFADGERAPMFR